jgi:thiamine biosynthesis lipoprotein
VTTRVEHCMGTVFTVSIRDDGDWSLAIADVVGWLHTVDATFSTYRPDSDICRIHRGELTVEDAHPMVTDVLDRCARVQHDTGGFFSSLIDGQVDPTGLVKGWAIERASAMLSRAGARNHAVNGGGDMQLAGEAEPGRAWAVGTTDPRDRSRVLSVIEVRDGAVATSGVTERGRHIVDPFTGRPVANGLASATVTGARLTEVDAYATAAFVMGLPALGWAEPRGGVEVLLVDEEGARHSSSGWTTNEIECQLQ